MNNRVKELIKEHGSDSSGKWVSIDKVQLIAELIVKECAEICLEANDYKNILQHFGIEE